MANQLGRFVPFAQCTKAQRIEAIRLHPKWRPAEFNRMEFWIKPDGHVSRRAGHHTLTAAALEDVRGALHPVARSKHDLQDFKTAKFSLDRSPTPNQRPRKATP